MSRTHKPRDDVFVILRLDNDAARLESDVAAVQVTRNRETAEGEAGRLNALNAPKGSKYVVLPSREFLTKGSVAGESTRKGFINPNGQVVIAATGLAGTDHMQRIYVLLCTQPGCGHEYGANGSDIHARLCPRCQSGAPGLDCALAV